MPTLFNSLDALVPFARLRAKRGIYDGRMSAATAHLLQVCSHLYKLDPYRNAALVYTRDAGHHTSGWWKNPDYERCLHLSVSFRARSTGQPLEHDHDVAAKVAKAFFESHTQLAWIEPPYSPEGQTYGVWHYRVFCDPSWSPMLPRGEVYSRENTPAGWKSFSELHGYTPTQEDAPWLLATSESGK